MVFLYMFLYTWASVCARARMCGSLYMCGSVYMCIHMYECACVCGTLPSISKWVSSITYFRLWGTNSTFYDKDFHSYMTLNFCHPIKPK